MISFLNKVLQIDWIKGLKKLPDESVDCCVTSPPYWRKRDYGVDGQLGQEPTFQEYIDKLIEGFIEVRRVLKPTGTCFVNLGDSFNTASGRMTQIKSGLFFEDNIYGLKGESTGIPTEQIKNYPRKSLFMLPERFAIAMIDLGYVLRNQLIWHKPNQMPESATDRFTVDFEKIFFFTKQDKDYYFEQQLEKATGYDGRKELEYKGGNKDVSIGKHKRWKMHKNVQEKGQQPNSMHVKRASGESDENYYERNMRCVWSVNTKPYAEAHYATFPELLAERMIRAGCPEEGVVLDPFSGAGTTAIVAKKIGRNFVGFEINEHYVDDFEKRQYKEFGLFL